MAADPCSSVLQFYAGKTIFLTGTTGFVGKVLLEKILHSLPDIECIYVLVRDKKLSSASDRLEQLFKSPVFAGPGRVSQDLLRTKVMAIAGDLTKPGLGLDDLDRATIVSRVNIVFHCAASIRFEDPVKEALRTNFLGTKSVADLCHQMPLLEAFVYVSTCYSNFHLAQVEEKVYKTGLSGDRLWKMSEIMSDDDLDKYAKQHLFEGRPNSYTFTKAVAENYVADTCQDFPVAIARLPITVPALAEPEPGFCDTAGAANFVVLTVGMGVLRSFKYDPACKLPLIPVDHAASGLILAAHHVATAERGQVVTFNMALGDACSVNVGRFMRTIFPAVERCLSYKRVRPVPDVTRPPSNIGHAHKVYVMEYLYSFLVNLLCILMLRKPYAYAGLKRVTSLRDQFECFTHSSPRLCNDNYRKLGRRLSAEERAMFNIRIEDVTQVLDDQHSSLSYVTSCITSFMKYKFNEVVTFRDTAARERYIKKLQYEEALAFVVLHAILGAFFYSAYCYAISTVYAVSAGFA